MKFIDASQIEKLLLMEEMIHEIEDYYANNREENSFVPERLFINDEKNTAILMPSFHEDYYATKVIGIAPGNKEIGEPTLRGVIVLYDRKTMKPLLLLDARTITAIRTGALSGVGMKYMAEPQASTVGVIGTGDQGWSHLRAACAVRPIKNVLINNRSKDRLRKFIAKARETFPDINFMESTPNEILHKGDIIITTTTSSEPVLPKVEDIDLSGKHFAGSGSFKSHMQEIPDYIIKNADHISVDSYAAFKESGEMIAAEKMGYTEDKVMDIKRLVLHGQDETLQKGTTIFKSVGVAILDLLAAKLVYEKVKVKL